MLLVEYAYFVPLPDFVVGLPEVFDPWGSLLPP